MRKVPINPSKKSAKTQTMLNIWGNLEKLFFLLKRGNKIKSKISDCKKKAIMVGYVRNSTGNTMLNLDTERVTNTRDIK